MRKHQDLVGKRFGKLVVTEELEDREDGYCMWQCRCDCGREITASTKKLTRGTVKDCGCVPKKNARCGPQAEDLAGQVFGSLTVLSRTKNRGERTCWLCACECGRKVPVLARDLKAGRVKNCGCRAEDRKTTALDITGRLFGRLTALSPTKNRDSKGSIYWNCRCSCGKEVEVSTDQLLHGKYQSCGCLRAEYWRDIHNQLHFVDGTCLEWLEKRHHRSDNTSGFRGVNQNKQGRFRTSIGFKGKRYYIGTFRNFNDAVQARMDVERLIHEGFVRAYYLWQQNAEQDPRWGEENPFVFEVEKRDGVFRINTNVEVEE